jgi:hypothetical protein
MSSKSTLFNILPVISFNPPDTTSSSYISVADFIKQDGSDEVVSGGLY